MATLGRSLKSPSLLSPMASRRPGLPGRSLSNLSNASEASSAPNSPGELFQEDFIFSAKPSPTVQASSPWPVPAKKPGGMHCNLPESSPQISPASAARPIAIELPVVKKATPSSSSVYTPPAPLSARGDLPGGYFPLHEDQTRIYRSHPFHLDASKARQRSIQCASQSCTPDSLPTLSASSVTSAPLPPPVSAKVPLLPKMPSRTSAPSPPTASNRSSNNNTPVASYLPSGSHASPLPMGKYYPSNYENQQPPQHVLPPRPSAAVASAADVKSDSQVPTVRGDGAAGHSRQESEAKRRLQQYQRDMIAQASLALHGGNVNAAALNAISLRSIGFTSMPTKPSKPNLVPLGSPGPITPLDLETHDDGYLGVRVRRSEELPPTEEVSRAIRAEERRRREEASSPALNPVC